MSQPAPSPAAPNPSNDIYIAETDTQIAACFDVMAQLRPHLLEEEFVARVRAQQPQGYRLVALRADGLVRAVAGYRLLDTLVSGHHMYVDDLVTDDEVRSLGLGARLFAWLMAEATRLGCTELQLDSGVHRFAAHRFYFRERMHVSAYHFRLPLRRA